MADDASSIVILDTGSDWIRGGLATDDRPRAQVPTVVANIPGGIDPSVPTHYVGAAALRTGGMGRRIHPVEAGQITDITALEELWKHVCVDEMRLAPPPQDEDKLSEYSYLVTEAPDAHTTQRQQTAQVFFESFKAQGLRLEAAAALRAYPLGVGTALVVESGPMATWVVPVYEYSVVRNAVQTIPLGGREVTHHLSRLLTARGVAGYELPAATVLLNQIKEKCSFVAEDPTKPQDTGRTFELPDGQVLTLQDEAYKCHEVLFDPEVLNVHHPSLSKHIQASLAKVNPVLHAAMLQHVIPGGGNASAVGFGARLQRELRASGLPHPGMISVEQEDGAFVQLSAYMGAYLLCQQSTFKGSMITKAQYDETGPNIVRAFW